MRWTRLARSFGVAVCAVGFTASVARAQANVTYLGSAGARGDGATAISADGSVVVGFASWVAGIDTRAYRWSSGSSPQDLGTLGPGANPWSFAWDVSGDGLVVVGSAAPSDTVPSRAFRWTAGTGMQDIGSLGALDTIAYGTNADGSVVVGTSDGRAFRWDAVSGMVDLGTMGGLSAEARDVSDDGTVIVGTYTVSSGEFAFRWTAATGAVDLGFLLPNNPQQVDARACAVSGDGAVIVGTSSSRAFRWTAATGMQALHGPATNVLASAYGVNEDGTVVVGMQWEGFTPRAFRWTAATGVVAFDTPSSMTPPFPGCLPEAFAVSADGAFLAGTDSCQGTSAAWSWHFSTLGERYCVSAANSTGRGALLDVAGSDVVVDDDVTLSAEFLPTNAPGFFLASLTQGNTAQPAGSQGVLCLGGSIGRFNAPGQVQSSGALGFISLALDLSQFPGPNGAVMVQPGETWNFQAWYRDANPGSTSNFTDAVSVTFH